MRLYLLLSISLFVFWPVAKAVEYPGAPPGKVRVSLTDAHISIENAAIFGEWKLAAGKITSLTLENRVTRQSLTIEGGHMPRVLLQNGRSIDLSSLSPVKP